MRALARTGPGALGSRRLNTRARAARAAQQQPTGALAGLMLVYIVVVVGRIGDVVPGLYLLPLAKIVALAAIFVAFQSRGSLAPTRVWSLPLARLIIIFMTLAAVSILFSVLRSGTLGIITGTVLSVCICLVLTIKAAKDWAAVRRLLFACAVSAIVLAGAANMTSFAGRAGLTRSLDPNDFAFVLDGLLPIVVTFAIASRGLKRLGYGALSFWIVFTILLTQSRGGFLGLLVGIPVMALLAPTTRRGQLTTHPSALTVAIRVAIIMCAGALAWHSVPPTARARLSTLGTVAADGDMKEASDGRFTIWTATLPLALRRPWGWGAGSFPTVDGMFAGGRYRAPHNTFLQALIELGLPGFGLFIATILTSLTNLARESRAPVEPTDRNSLEKRAFARALIASLLALCVSGFFLSELYSNALWVVISLVCLLHRSTANTSAGTPRPVAA